MDTSQQQQTCGARTYSQEEPCNNKCCPGPPDEISSSSSFANNLQHYTTALFKQQEENKDQYISNNKKMGGLRRDGNTTPSSNINHAAGVIDSDQNDYHGSNEEQHQEQGGTSSSITYAKFDAVLNVCDTDSGPAIEVRTTSFKKFSKQMEHFELADFDEKLDSILNLSGGEDSITTNTQHECFLERIIPLGTVGHAARGGKWELENMFQVGSGNFSCGIKVYSTANDFQLIGHGKKILLFDLAEESPIDRDDTITYINSLVKWNSSRVAYKSTVEDESGDFSLHNICW